MSKDDKIKELEETIKKAQEQIQELKAMKDSKVWKPKTNGGYYSIYGDGDIGFHVWNASQPQHQKKYEVGNCFKTRKEAAEAVEIKKIDTELRRYALEHNEADIDWKNGNQAKYFIEYNTNARLCTNCIYSTKAPNQIYFTSTKIALEAIEAIGRDRVEKWAKA